MCDRTGVRRNVDWAFAKTVGLSRGVSGGRELLGSNGTNTVEWREK